MGCLSKELCFPEELPAGWQVSLIHSDQSLRTLSFLGVFVVKKNGGISYLFEILLLEIVF